MNNIRKIQKPTCSKIHKNLTYNPSRKNLYGQLQEVPAVFSHATYLEFVREVSGDEIQECLEDWIEELRQWVSENKYFVGHIKIFAESENKLSLWISTTGKKINIKALRGEEEGNIKGITINMTAIVFKVDEETLKSVILKTLDRYLSQHTLINNQKEK